MSTLDAQKLIAPPYIKSDLVSAPSVYPQRPQESGAWRVAGGNIISSDGAGAISTPSIPPSPALSPSPAAHLTAREQGIDPKAVKGRLLRHIGTNPRPPEIEPPLPELPDSVCTRTAVDALLGDADTREDAIRHLVSMCMKARRKPRYSSGFAVEATVTPAGLASWPSTHKTNNGDTRRAARGVRYEEPDDVDRDHALMHVTEWLAPFVGKTPYEIHVAACNGVFRHIASNFSNRQSNAARDERNRYRLARFIYPDVVKNPAFLNGKEVRGRFRTHFNGESFEAQTDGEIGSMWGHVGIDDAVNLVETRRLFQIDLKRAVDALPEEQAKAFVLHHLCDLPYAAIAKLDGVTEEAIRSRVARALAVLRPFLKNYLREFATIRATRGE
jgi:RNA polymerase sigma factor (sigma-70 family)